MSAQPVNTAGVAQLAWFGKLPAYGDFVGRGLPQALLADWDYWVRSGLDQLRSDAPGDWVHRYMRSPLWCFSSASGFSGVPVCGVIAPSTDRVGRHYPIAVIAASTESALSLADDGVVSAFYAGASAAIFDVRRLALGVDDFDLRLSDVPTPYCGAEILEGVTADSRNGLSGILIDLGLSGGATPAPIYQTPPDLWRGALTPGSETSVWWVPATSGQSYQEFVHQGPMHRGVFARLFLGNRH